MCNLLIKSKILLFYLLLLPLVLNSCNNDYDDELYEDVYKWTAELSMVPQLTAITDINAGKKNFISGLERITSGTTFTIQYSDGTSEAGTLHGDNNYWDTKENEIQLVLKRQDDT